MVCLGLVRFWLDFGWNCKVINTKKTPPPRFRALFSWTQDLPLWFLLDWIPSLVLNFVGSPLWLNWLGESPLVGWPIEFPFVCLVKFNQNVAKPSQILTKPTKIKFNQTQPLSQNFFLTREFYSLKLFIIVNRRTFYSLWNYL